MENVQIIILAAGKSKRMQSEEPKALALLQGKPFLAHILDTLKKLDLKAKPIIVVGHKKERIQEVIGNDYKYAVQEDQLGTGHAVSSAKESVENGHKIVIVLSTDHPLVSKEIIEQIISAHKQKNPAITMATLTVNDFEDWRSSFLHFGRIVRGENGKISRNVEFKDATPAEKEIKEVNPALYAFDSDWLWENLGKIKNENAQSEYYLTDLVRIAREQGKEVETVPIDNPIEALQPNTPEELRTLERLAVHNLV